MGLTINEAKKYIKELGFDIDLENKYVRDLIKECVKNDDKNSLEHYMKQCQNCGGFALGLPICIFSGDNYTFEEKVLRIQELYPFVRLLDNTKLKDNEYIVAFRAKNKGHHFIKINEDGEVVEKNEASLPSVFKGWGNLENAPEAIFAVIKQENRTKEMKELPQCNRDMFLDQEAYEEEYEGMTYISTRKANKPITFEDKLNEAYYNRKSSFIYNRKEFFLKTNKEDKELIYICNEKDILGEACIDGKDIIMELDEQKKNEIFGFNNKNLHIIIEQLKSKQNDNER